MPLRANQLLLVAHWMRRRTRMRAMLQKPNREWSSSVFLRRDLDGWEATLLPTLQKDSVYSLSDFLRINEETFNAILSKLEPRLTKHSRRKPISARLRLLITLSFLAGGSSYHELRLVSKFIENLYFESFSWIRLICLVRFVRSRPGGAFGWHIIPSA